MISISASAQDAILSWEGRGSENALLADTAEPDPLDQIGFRRSIIHFEDDPVPHRRAPAPACLLGRSDHLDVLVVPPGMVYGIREHISRIERRLDADFVIEAYDSDALSAVPECMMANMCSNDI